jgi:hypothetical protein
LTGQAKKDADIKAAGPEEVYLDRLLYFIWGWQMKPLDPFAPFDRVAYKDERRKALVEYKSRYWGFGAYDKEWLNCKKFLTMMLYAARIGLPAYYILKYPDRVVYLANWEWRRSDWTIEMCERTAKPLGIKDDRQAVIEIPRDYFIKLTDLPPAFEGWRE